MPRPPDPDLGVAPDGSPVAVYLRLPAGDVPDLIHAAVPPGAQILELGSGVGRVTHALVALGHTVVAVDNSAEMLEHVHGARTVLADVETLTLDERFDAVLLASHFINTADAGVRSALWAVCAAHVRPRGSVLIERYEPGWARVVSADSRTIDGVTVSWHDVVHRGEAFDAAVTYEVDGHSWTQRFSAEVLDDDTLIAQATAAGLSFDAWLDEDRKWARFVARD